MRFKPEQRVKYISPQTPWFPERFHAADMGGRLVMHLNARDEWGTTKPITGTILKAITEPDGSHVYDFMPDGWILPESGWPRGFQAPEKDLYELDDPNEYLPGTITDRAGKEP